MCNQILVIFQIRVFLLVYLVSEFNARSRNFVNFIMIFTEFQDNQEAIHFSYLLGVTKTLTAHLPNLTNGMPETDVWTSFFLRHVLMFALRGHL